MPNTLVECDANTNEKLPVALKAAALLDRLHQQLPELEGETLCPQIGDTECLRVIKTAA